MTSPAGPPDDGTLDAIGDPFAGHAEQYRPLAAYGVLTATFNAGLAAFLVAAERRGKLPERYAPGDLALIAVGTFKLSRVIAKDRVTSVLRAPFTRHEGSAGHGEVDEAARGWRWASCWSATTAWRSGPPPGSSWVTPSRRGRRGPSRRSTRSTPGPTPCSWLGAHARAGRLSGVRAPER